MASACWFQQLDLLVKYGYSHRELSRLAKYKDILISERCEGNSLPNLENITPLLLFVLAKISVSILSSPRPYSMSSVCIFVLM